MHLSVSSVGYSRGHPKEATARAQPKPYTKQAFVPKTRLVIR